MRGTIAALLVAILVVLLLGCTSPPSKDTAPTLVSSTTTTVLAQEDARVEAARAATLRIRSTSSCEGVGVGSGFMLSNERLITNRHVVSGARDVNVESWDGTPVDVSVTGQGEWADLAQLHLTSSPTHVLRLARSNPRTGTAIYVFGYPGGRALTIAPGKVSGYTTNVELGNLGRIMKIDAHIEPGNSGGPVVNDRDEVVGVVYATEKATGDGLAVPVTTLKDVMNDPRAMRPVEACSGFFSP